MARYLGESGKQEKAIAVLKFCLESFPESVDAYLSLGLAYMETGQNQAAVKSIEAALKIDKGNALAARRLEWAKDALKAKKSPVILSLAKMGRFVRDYGPRHITLRKGRLYYQREGRPEYRLFPLSRDTFALEGYGRFRIRFVSDESGRVAKLVGLYIQGNTDESPRDR